MKNFFVVSLLTVGLVAEKAFASCGPACTVPEIDGGAAVMAIGLTAGLVALIRERSKKQ